MRFANWDEDSANMREADEKRLNYLNRKPEKLLAVHEYMRNDDRDWPYNDGKIRTAVDAVSHDEFVEKHGKFRYVPAGHVNGFPVSHSYFTVERYCGEEDCYWHCKAYRVGHE